MSATASTDWGPALEDALFLTVAHRHVPGLPARRATPPRGPETPAEVQALCDDWVRTAAYDLFIVQAVARAMHTVFADDPHVQLLLSRQLGDDGDHAVEARRHLWALRGSDPLPESSATWPSTGRARATSRSAAWPASWPSSSTTSCTSWRACRSCGAPRASPTRP